jgi:hypothetical protein
MTSKLSKASRQPIEEHLSPEGLQKHEERMQRAFARHCKVHGMKFLSCSRKEVAAHEAGHCIAPRAMGDHPTFVEISQVNEKAKRVPYEAWIG